MMLIIFLSLIGSVIVACIVLDAIYKRSRRKIVEEDKNILMTMDGED